MSRKRLFIALTAVVVFVLGVAVGYFFVPDSKGKSAECIILSNDLKDLTYQGSGEGSTRAQRIVDRYNQECR